jgi:hypothetical protein
MIPFGAVPERKNIIKNHFGLSEETSEFYQPKQTPTTLEGILMFRWKLTNFQHGILLIARYSLFWLTIM